MKRWPSFLLICTIAVLAVSALPHVAQAHMLNMTHIGLQVEADGASQLTLRIDLGQSLMSADEYWHLANAPSEDQPELAESVLAGLAARILVSADDELTSMKLIDWSFPATSLAAIENPLTPQMATLIYLLDREPSNSLSLALEKSLQIPWPCLVRLDIAGRELPISRLLNNVDRSSNVLWLQGEEPLGGNPIDAKLALASMHWLPSLGWVAVGFQHIIPDGLDHIAFVLALFFLSTAVRPLILQVTAFTLAHSLTLGLAIYGVVQVPSAIIEPLIAASIIYVAIDNLYANRLASFRLFVVTTFGLLHGLGFAGALQDLHIPQEAFFFTLVLFNVGVELGQIAVLICAFGLVGWFRRRTWYETGIADPAAMAIAGIGTYWLIKRVVF